MTFAIFVTATIAIGVSPTPAAGNEAQHRSPARAIKPPHVDIPIDSELAKLTITQLIERLRTEEGEAFSALSAYNFFPTYVPDPDRGLSDPVPPAIMRELVRRGHAALPMLLKHLTDTRKVKMKFVGTSPFGGPDTIYEFCIGDLCYVIVGQIVNERLSVIESRGKLGASIRSLAKQPVLATPVIKRYRGFTRAQLKAKLIRDVQSSIDDSNGDSQALTKLCLYFPRDGERIALKMLRRPFYDYRKIWDFIEDRLVVERDPKQWKPMIEEYVRKNGVAAGEMLPFWIHWIFCTTTSYRTEFVARHRGNARKLLKRHYPNYSPKKPEFFNAVSLDDQASTISALRSVRSDRIDAAVYRLYLLAKRFPLDKESEYRREGLVEECVDRLVHTRFGKPFREYCRRKLRKAEAGRPVDKALVDYWHKKLTGKEKYPQLDEDQLAVIRRLSKLDAEIDDRYGETATLHGRKITDRHFAQLEEFPNLTSLSLIRTRITNAGLSRLTAFPKLTWLNLTGTEIRNNGLKSVQRLKHLRVLLLEDTRITGKDLKHIAGLTGIEQLELAGTEVDDEGLVHLKRLRNLKTLNLKRTSITGRGFRFLGGLSQLETLDLEGCRNIEDVALKHFAKLPKLRELSIHSDRITDGGMKYLAGEFDTVHLNCPKVSPVTMWKMYNSPQTPKIKFDVDFVLRDVGGKATLKTAWLNVEFEGVVLASKHDGTLHLGDSSGSMGSSAWSGSGKTRQNLTVHCQNGIAAVEFKLKRTTNPPLNLEYRFNISRCGTRFQCGKQTFEIGKTKRTIIINPQGKAKLLPLKKTKKKP